MIIRYIKILSGSLNNQIAISLILELDVKIMNVECFLYKNVTASVGVGFTVVSQGTWQDL